MSVRDGTRKLKSEKPEKEVYKLTSKKSRGQLSRKKVVRHDYYLNCEGPEAADYELKEERVSKLVSRFQKWTHQTCASFGVTIRRSSPVQTATEKENDTNDGLASIDDSASTEFVGSERPNQDSEEVDTAK